MYAHVARVGVCVGEYVGGVCRCACVCGYFEKTTASASLYFEEPQPVRLCISRNHGQGVYEGEVCGGVCEGVCGGVCVCV